MGETPMVPGQTFQFFTRGEDNWGTVRNLSWDIQSLEKGQQGFWPVQARFLNPGGGLRVSLLRKENLSDTLGIYLVESISKQVWPLNKQGASINLTRAQLDEGLFSIAVGSEDYARNLSSEYLMKFVNAPNPFSANTVFSFSLPPSVAKLEGIIHALESAHAIAEVVKCAQTMPRDAIVIVNLSGRGDKDLDTEMRKLGEQGIGELL